MTRCPRTGALLVPCYLCGRSESGGSFDRVRFAVYLRSLGWRPHSVYGVTVWMCPGCQRDGGA
jgi:hypothetical protein